MKAPRLFLSLSALLAAAPLAVTVHAAPDAVHSVSFSHEDVGYANNPYVLRTENRLENMFRSLRYCDETADRPDAAKYRYQQEVSEPVPFFLSAATTAERERFAGYIRDGRLKIAASHTTILADRLTPESAARLFYVSGRHLPDMLDVPAAKVGMINDVTGLPWSLPIYFEAAQVPWLFHGHNSCGRCDELESAPLVRWTGAGGTGSVIVHSDRYNPYHSPNPAKLIPGYVKQAKAEKIPLILYGWDFSLTDRKFSDAALDWNAKNPGKIVRIATFEDWFAAQEKRAKPVDAPHKTGPCQWMDQPITDAWLFGRVRQAAERLPAGEIWNSFAQVNAPESGHAYPWFDFTKGWHTLLSNFEHTVGAACWRCKDEAGFIHYETEQVEHREEGLVAADLSERALSGALDALASRIETTHTNAFAVFNPLARARTEAVKVVAPAGLKGKSLAAVDDASGVSIPCQWLDATTLAFTAKDVPALGYRSYHFVDRAADVSGTSAPQAAESPFYKVVLDPASGCIVSLVDKELGKELVKKGAEQAFNQYLRLHIDSPNKREFIKSPIQSGAKITVERGPVADILRVRADADNTGGIEQTITLWHGVKRVDFALRVAKGPSGRTLADYVQNNLRGKEAVFTSLPFDIPNFKAVYQTGGGGVAEPVKDQFSGTGTAFHAVQHFADLSNAEFGVTVSPIDNALVEFGPPRADAVSRVLPGSESHYEQTKEYPKDSTLQLFLMNNMFSTNIRIDQRGLHEFHWALRSHAGDWQKGDAAIFGEGVNRPLVARAIPAGGKGLPAGTRSFASVDAPNVTVTTIKPAELNGEGYIVRLVETEGRATTAKFSAPAFGALAKVEEVSLTEAGLGKTAAVAAGVITVDLPAFGVKTLRLVPAGNRAAPVAGLTAKPVSDMEVALAWAPTPGAAYYRVYRGDKPDFKCTPLTLVAVTAEPRHTDKAENHGTGWIVNSLHPETQYHWRVEAVGRDNLRGAPSAVVTAKTLAEATCAPGAVEDLHAIAVTPLAPVNKINLLWRSNVEPNIAAYEIHRSTEAGFTPSDKTLLAKQPVRLAAKGMIYRGLNHQEFLDKTAKPETTYHYKVRAVTTGGLVGKASAEAVAATRKDIGNAKIEKVDIKKLMGNDAAQ